MNAKHVIFDWRFGARWLILCAVGTAIGGAIAFLTMWSVGEAVAEIAGEVAGGLVAGGLFGGLLGLGANAGPAFLLQRRGISGARWLALSGIVACLSAGIAIAGASESLATLSPAANTIFIGVVLGLPLGIVQWVILRQHDVAAPAWPLISVVAYLLAAVVMTSGSENSTLPLLLGGIALLVGTVTGLGSGVVVAQKRIPATLEGR